ncbi:MAG: FAD-dependent oxidoreductase [Nitrospinales bacterium]
MKDCCEDASKASDLVIVGGGSAAFAGAIKADAMGAQVTLINGGLPIGGACVNVGCVPSKTLIRAAAAHHRASHHHFAGIDSQSRVTDFKAVIAQKRELVEELRSAKYSDLIPNMPHLRVIEGRAQLVDPHVVQVNGERLNSDHIIISTGSSPLIPSIPGLAETGYLTTETAFELDELPESLIVLGGGYIGLECSQMFARLGSRVTLVELLPRILPNEMPDLSQALTEYLEEENIEIITGAGLFLRHHRICLFHKEELISSRLLKKSMQGIFP